MVTKPTINQVLQTEKGLCLDIDQQDDLHIYIYTYMSENKMKQLQMGDYIM